jgi:cell division protein ZapA
MMMQNRVEVEIFENKCVVVGDEDEGYIKVLANYVDCEIRKIVEHTKTITTVRAVLLAALNIADDLFKLKEEHSTLLDYLSHQEKELFDKIQIEMDTIDRT